MNLYIRDFKNDRIVYLNDAIDQNTVSQIKKDIQAIIDNDKEVMNNNIAEMSKLGEEVKATYQNSIKIPDITLDLSSPGGSVLAGIGLYDYIFSINEYTDWNIKCVANGFIASMATIVILACNDRVALPNTSFMVHSLSNIEYGKLQDLRDSTEELERINEIITNIYVNRTNITKEQFDEIIKYKKDWWFDSVKAVELGIIKDIKF